MRMVEHQQTPILDQMEEQIYVRDLEMNLLFINRAAAALTGWSQSEARGRKCWEVFGDPGNTCREVCPVDRAIAAKEPILHHEGVLETRSGAVRNMRVAISPLFDGDDVAGAAVSMLDITRLVEVEQTHVKTVIALAQEVERRQVAERRLRERNLELKRVNAKLLAANADLRNAAAEQRSLLDASIDGFWIVSGDARLLRVNEAYCAMSGYSEAELLSLRISDLEAVEKPEATAARIERIIRRGGDRFETRHRRKDGAVFDVEVSVQRHPIHEGQMVCFLRDISGRARAEREAREAAEALARSNEELGQFAYVASHDLREPLRMVVDYSKLLARRYEGRLDEKADMYIGYAVDGAKRMMGLIDDLLAVSRVETYGKPFEPTDCGEVVSVVLQDLAGAVTDSGARVSVGQLPTVMADRTQLGQVFQNLIGNAIKFRRDEPPRIDVGAEPRGASWEFYVADNGIGIDPRFFERIFVVFQRLHERGKYPGSGIGLSIVRKIIGRHGGRIRIESVPGEGSRFLFTLGRCE